jgi:3-oxo-5-alpha-steroid 4-dehydrogenase 1
MGKTSVDSRFNIPGRVAWLTMESPGFLTLLYIMGTLTKQQGIPDLPWQNKVLAGLFVIHYSYRAIMYPLMAASMSPIHFFVWCAGLTFQLFNATSIAAWLAAYGPTTAAEWSAQLSPWSTLQFVVGIAVFYLGLAANYYHDDELREIRRREEHRRSRKSMEDGTPVEKVDKHYSIPEAGLFKYMLYPHYFVEWIEWTGFYMAAGWSCLPARMFVVNEVFAMLPRAVKGKQWYVQRFGADQVGRRYAVIPGVI